MQNPINKSRNWAIAFGVGFLVVYLLLDFFWQQIWLWSFFLLLFFSIGFIVFVIKCLLKKEWVVLLYVLVVSIGIAGKEIATSEVFKSPIILNAALHDDLSVIYLRLRENKTFEVKIVSIFSSETFTGRYHLTGDKLVFLDKHFYDRSIPDTLTITKDKVCIRLDSLGEPTGNYFTVLDNKILVEGKK